MNRAIDYRTDFYSLGVTFYEILTGELPFKADDSLELIYCHIAREPLPPHRLNRDVPHAVSSIVMKLLSKNAEDRYQSAYEIKADLEICLTQLLHKKKIERFVAGELDKSGQFVIPQKLYGREREVTTLISAFERVSSGKTEAILVSGYSGIGKSSIVNEVYKPIVKQRGYFCAGKFDQFKRNMPYAALKQAFGLLLRQLLTETPEQIRLWQETLRSRLGTNGKIVANVIPELELIIGSQPEVAQLDPGESQNRFNRVFKEFVGVFARPKHPLVLFLDDLQWADLASLKAIEQVSNDSDCQYLMLIGAYRDNEVEPTHPLMQTIEKINQRCKVNRISLQPLHLNHVEQLIADTLHCKLNYSKNLAELIYHKTGGNPFFIERLLYTLHSEKLLTYDFNYHYWQWDIKQIQAIGITEYNIVELIAKNLQKLPQPTQQVLKLAACIGDRFDLNVLAMVNNKSQSDTAADLWAALQAGMILPLSDAYKIPLVLELETIAVKPYKVTYKFLHDRVQQAAYSLILETDKPHTHRQIGQLLLKQTPAEQIEDNIFDIVNQLNIARETIDEQSEKYRLAELNLIAGKKARAAMAYEAAAKYLNVGIELLPEDSWHIKYQLTLDIYVQAAEAAYITTDFDRAEILTDVVLQQAKTLLEKVSIYKTKIQYCIAQNQMELAIETARAILKQLGVNLPQNPSKLRIFLALMETKFIQGFKEIASLVSLAKMTAPDKLATMQILEAMTPAVYVAMPEMFPLVILTIVKLSLKYGNAPMSTIGYNGYGLIHCAVLGDIDRGYEYGQLCLQLLKKLHLQERQAETYLVFNTFIRHWKESITETLEPLQQGIQSGLEMGNVEESCFCATQYCGYLFLSGEFLELVKQKQTNYIELIEKSKQEVQLIHAKVWGQLVANLRGNSDERCYLTGELFDEATMLPYAIETKNNLAVFAVYLSKTILCYWFKDYTQAVNNSLLSERYIGGVLGSAYIPVRNFYYSLALLAIYPTASRGDRQKYLKQVGSYQKQMRHWATHAPANYQHKYELVKAEIARVLGKHERAAEYYDRAIKNASEFNYLQEESLAAELAAEFYYSQGKEKIAKVYLTDAYYGYFRWGALAKVRDLELKYPQLISQVLPRAITIADPKLTTVRETSTAQFDQLDLSSAIEASQAISSEIVLNNLLSKLMRIVMKNVGAERGLLFLKEEKSLVLTLEKTLETERAISLPDREAVVSLDWPVSIIDYIQNTKETVILNQADTEGLFTNDPDIINRQLKSILGLPLIYKGTLQGIIYLENSLVTSAFNRQHLKILKVLISQVSISIENARLYQNLERQAFYDELTGLANRTVFSRRLSEAITHAALNRQQFAVLFLDLDRFKNINDTLGHTIGDRLLQCFAKRLNSCFRPGDTVARWGGDEFTVLLSKIEQTEDIAKICQRIIETLQQPFCIEEHKFYVRNSIGIAMYPQDGEDSETLVKNADIALYRAKEQGRNQYKFYNSNFNSRNKLLKVENLLYQALENQEFVLYYQPQINVETGKVFGMEALLRWEQPEMGVISPAQFIPLAEETGSIFPIGEWVLRTACAQNKAWQEAGFSPITMSVNLSPRQFQQPTLFSIVASILEETELKPNFLELEITETSIITNINFARDLIGQFQKIGVYVSMDDFGTGYSSLSYLKQLPLDTLKIDRSFVRELRNEPKDIAIISAITAIGQGLNLKIIVEGVETVEQVKLLQSLQCQNMQGYFFSKPLKAEDATKFLTERYLFNLTQGLKKNNESDRS